MLALGATLGRGLDIPGNDADGVLRAIEFLINVNQGFKANIGERVVVIGGGNVALDAARTALRAAAYGERPAAGVDLPPGENEMTEAVDVARSALQDRGQGSHHRGFGESGGDASFCIRDRRGED